MIGVTVHTTGVNWDGILANTAALVIIMGSFGALVTRSIRHGIRDEIAEVINTEVTPVLDEIRVDLREHDTRIARLEGVEEGKKQAIAQAGVTKS